MKSIRRWMTAACCALGLLAPVAASAQAVDAIVVKVQDEMLAPGALELPDAMQRTVQAALGVPFAPGARTRDGAFTLVLPAALDHDAARAAINRIRLDPGVVYANVAPGAPIPATAGRPTDRLIVKYKDAALSSIARTGLPLDAARVRGLEGLAGVPLAWSRGGHDGSNVLQMLQRLPIDEVEAIAARIAQQPDVDYAQPDYILTAQLVPTDPCYASAGAAACGGAYQWDLFDPVGGINMPAAWDITTGAVGINVAVIDTGALLGHPDLAGRFAAGYDMIADCAVANDDQPGPCTWSAMAPAMTSRDADASDPGDWVTSAENTGGVIAPPYTWFQGCGASDSSWHGTHVAGTIGAVPNNGIGVVGINWVGKIVPLRVLGKCGGYTSDVAAAMVWAAGGSVAGLPVNANPARVLSLSLSGGGSCDTASQNAINAALALNAVVVVAAGNSNASAAAYSPASCSGVITVAATTKTGKRARYSNYGSAVEIAAPGGNADGVEPDILSTLNSGLTSPNPSGYDYESYAGTSMATPHVSGVVSLMLSVNAALTPAQVMSKIQTTARAFPAPGPACNATPQAAACNCTTALCGAGILNAAAAVASASITLPEATTGAASAITTTGATLNGSVNGNGSATVVSFQYGLTTGYGSVVAAAQSPLPGGAAGTAVSAAVSGLACNTPYHFRVVGTSVVGTSNGADASFVTSSSGCLGVLTPSPTTVAFGGQSMNTKSFARVVTITSTGGTAVSVSSAAASTHFAVSHDCATVAAGASCLASVTFRPTAEGPLAGTLTVGSSVGTQTVPLSGIGERSLVTHFYQSILRRGPEAQGKADWEGVRATLQLWGANVNEVWYAIATSFLFSSEYLALNRDDAGFVTDLYLAFLNRAPDAQGLADWTALLGQGMPREVVVTSFMFSGEFAVFTQNLFGNVPARKEIDTVMDFYRGLLARVPDATGFNFWLQKFRTAQCVGAAEVAAAAESISSGFTGSAEYLGRGRTTGQYVGDLYNAFLRRGGEPAGVQYWIDQIDTGARTREGVRQQFVASPEFGARVAAIVAEGCLP